MRSYQIRVGPYLIRRGPFGYRDTGRMPYVTDVETAPLQLQAKECQGSLAITRS